LTAAVPNLDFSAIKNAANIVEIVSETIQLKRVGKNYMGLCPFHTEKTPSFSVSPEKGLFYCFGCGEGGDVLTFLMLRDGIGFIEAARYLSRKYGVAMPERQLNPHQQRRLQARERQLALHRTATEYFSHTLEHPRLGKPARAYLKQRGITAETSQTFRLGYAPDGWDRLSRRLNSQGKALEPAIAAGLIMARNEGGGHYDRFRNRIIFPIVDVGGQVIGFGGRALDDAKPKYLNSPETLLFNKRRMLYGLPTARTPARQKGVVYLVEGFFDALALYQHGITNTLATMGTALSREHVGLLKGFAQRVNLVFDSDAAGIKAAQRSAGLFLDAHVEARVLVLPPGHDPDSFLFAEGPEKFQQAADKALGLVPFLMETAIERNGLEIEGKVRTVAEMKPILGAIRDRVARSVAIKTIAERLQIEENTLLDEVRGAMRPSLERSYSGRNGNSFARVPDQRPDPKSAAVDPGIRFERLIVAMMINYPLSLQDIKERNIIEHFKDRRLSQLARLIADESLSGVEPLMTRLEDPDILQLVASLMMDSQVPEKEQWDAATCSKLLDQYQLMLNRQGSDWVSRIKAAESSGDEELLAELTKQMLAEKQAQTQQPKLEK